MKVWISKKALKEGIFEMEVTKISEDGKKVYGKAWNQVFCGKGREWHETYEDAVSRAEEMREKEIEKLQKKIDILRNLKF